ncbi:hypothetical protein [Aestuariivirga sp.]|uniref:hypothetical protein n=1 Tax=Aestuariivirga sp. TaxID=2650926 RepID=UPI0025B88DE4|nr:hypothetical protein [Aestuariivirga sp.]MCA3556134.1 hypothetical protein [Aestuariivirga sp.]
MEQFVSSGHLATAILVAIAIEVAAAGCYLWRRRNTRLLLCFVANGLAGASLVLALRAALQQSGWLFVAVYLVGGLLAHLADVVLRLSLARHADGVPSTE